MLKFFNRTYGFKGPLLDYCNIEEGLLDSVPPVVPDLLVTSLGYLDMLLFLDWCYALVDLM